MQDSSYNPDFIKELQEKIGAAHIPDGVDEPRVSKVTLSKRVAGEYEKLGAKWQKLETGHKVNAGISGACAVLSAYGALSAASNAMTRDENGKVSVHMSQVGVALLQAMVAAGCGYFALEALHGRSGF